MLTLNLTHVSTLARLLAYGIGYSPYALRKNKFIPETDK